MTYTGDTLDLTLGVISYSLCNFKEALFRDFVVECLQEGLTSKDQRRFMPVCYNPTGRNGSRLI